jgi:hypothetical protein
MINVIEDRGRMHTDQYKVDKKTECCNAKDTRGLREIRSEMDVVGL